MLKQSFGKSFLLFQIISICSFSLIIGIAILKYPPILVFGALAIPIFMFAMIKRPEIGLLVILITTSSIVFENQLPMLSGGGISFHISDLVLLGALGLIIIRWLAEPTFDLVHTSLDLPLLVFYAVTLLATVISLLQSTVDVQTALRETRSLTYYLSFFIVTNLVRERRQLNLLINGFFLLAVIVAITMIAQFLLGTSVQILPGNVDNLVTMGSIYEGVTRIIPPGLSILLISFVALISIMVQEKFKPLNWLIFIQCCLLGLAVILTFLRSYWAALIFVFFILIFIIRWIDLQRLIKWALLIICIAAILLFIAFAEPDSRSAKLVGASMDRFSTLINTGTFQGEDSSLNWRMIENEYAFSAIASHPWLGLGMGFTYRPSDPRLDQRDPGLQPFDFRKFIHNGHLWILLQSGVLGYISLMWLSIAYLIRGFRSWQHIVNINFRGVVLGFTLVYLAVLISAVVNSTFMNWYWSAPIGIIMGINEVVLLKFDNEEKTI